MLFKIFVKKNGTLIEIERLSVSDTYSEQGGVSDYFKKKAYQEGQGFWLA